MAHSNMMTAFDENQALAGDSRAQIKWLDTRLAELEIIEHIFHTRAQPKTVEDFEAWDVLIEALSLALLSVLDCLALFPRLRTPFSLDYSGPDRTPALKVRYLILEIVQIEKRIPYHQSFAVKEGVIRDWGTQIYPFWVSQQERKGRTAIALPSLLSHVLFSN